VRLHLGARGIQSASVLPIACAAALLFWRPRGWRLGASVAAAIGFAAFSAGSIAFLDAFGRDALLVPAGPLRSTLIDGPALAELSLGFPASDLRLSPTGRHVAVTRGAGDEYGDASGTFFVGPARGPLVEVPATDLLFIGDEQVLTMEPRRGGIDLRRLRADAPGVRLWEHHVPGILVAQIAVDADARTWQAIGFDGTRRIVRVEGTIGEDALAPRRRTTGDRAGSLLALAAAGEAAVGVESRYAPALPFTLGLWRMGSWLPMGEMDSRIWAIVGSDRFDLGTSALEVRCVGERAGIPRLICVTFEGTRSRFVIVDPRSRRLSGVGLLPGRFFAGARASDGWLPGWYDGSSVAVRLDTGEVIRVAPPGGDDVVTEITGARYAAGAVLQNGSGSKIRVYSLNR
jgi:hypothetical protein